MTTHLAALSPEVKPADAPLPSEAGATHDARRDGGWGDSEGERGAVTALLCGDIVHFSGLSGVFCCGYFSLPGEAEGSRFDWERRDQLGH